MRVLLDTNVVIDLLLKREPWFTEALAFRQALQANDIVGYVSATTVTDIFYIARRLADLAVAHAIVRNCLDAFEICTVDGTVLDRATRLPGTDFEDNVQIVCALQVHLDAIVTRDAGEFRDSPVPAWSPAEVARHLGQP
jgi:predicted nucleic acid-binding protein